MKNKLNVVCGHRRLAAFKKLGRESIPAMVDGELKEVSLKDIEVFGNTRTELGDLSNLMVDIKQNGLLQPIVLTERMDKQEWLLKNLSENMHRENLTPLELYKGIKLFTDMGLSAKEIAARLSLPDTKIKNLMNLGRSMPTETLEKVGFALNKVITPGVVPLTTAQALWNLRIADADKRKLFNAAKKESWNLAKIHQVDTMLRTGLTIDKAIAEVDEYTSLHHVFALKTKKMEKLMKDYDLKNKTSLINAILKGEINQIDLKGLI